MQSGIYPSGNPFLYSIILFHFIWISIFNRFASVTLNLKAIHVTNVWNTCLTKENKKISQHAVNQNIWDTIAHLMLNIIRNVKWLLNEMNTYGLWIAANKKKHHLKAMKNYSIVYDIHKLAKAAMNRFYSERFILSIYVYIR